MQSLKRLVKAALPAALLLFLLLDPMQAGAQDCSVQAAIAEGEECLGESGVEDEVEASFGESPWISFLKMIAALLVVIALLVGLLKFVNKRARSFQESKALSLVSGVSLGGNRSVQMVKVGNKLLVVGVGEQVQLLHTIEDQDEIEAILKKQDVEGDGVSVSSTIDSIKASLLPKQAKDNESFQDVLTRRLKQSKQELTQDSQMQLRKRDDV
ncbi:flagellar biosynthetic protein FliO [Bacillus sp. JCM 19041]|uniref:flagellar biosynthetic protein FliO n=1 Tax=Bacillus sp. JCM 19041 TaxID=1460637 RepID=UPI0006D1E736